MDYILVTGSTGFIGSNFVEELLKKKYKVILLKRSFSDTWRIKHLLDNFSRQLVLIDIDLTDMEDTFSNYAIEGIFHLATYYNKNPTFEEIHPMAKSNLLFPINVLNLATKYGIKYFINTGTFMEYTLNDKQLVSSYDLNPKTFYASTKISFEEIVKYYVANYNIKASTLKIYSPYGDKDDVSKIIPYMINNLLNGEDININNPSNMLNLVHVDDIVSAFLQVRENIMNFDKYESFDIANNISYSLTDIYAFIKNYIEENNNIKINGIEIEKIPNIIYNEKISWNPKIEIELGLIKTIEYYKNVMEKK